MLIVTGDRDSFQLVSDHVTVLYPTKGVSELTRFTPEKVEEKYGLTPAQYPDFAALRGDPSDNLPGIPGVGEKTAAKWINQFGSFAELVERVEEVKGKAGQNLRDHLESVKLNRRLTELVRDVELPKARRRPGARAVRPRRRWRVVLDTLEIRNPNLRERLFAVDPGAEEDEAARRRPRASSWTARCSAPASWPPGWPSTAREPLGVATVDTWALGSGTSAEVALAAAGGPGRLVRPGRSWTRPTRRRSPPGSPTPARPKVLHNAKGAHAGLRRARLERRRRHHGHRARRLPGQAGPPLLRAGRAVPGVPGP